jgi:hypothetical protein
MNNESESMVQFHVLSRRFLEGAGEDHEVRTADVPTKEPVKVGDNHCACLQFADGCSRIRSVLPRHLAKLCDSVLGILRGRFSSSNRSPLHLCLLCSSSHFSCYSFPASVSPYFIVYLSICLPISRYIYIPRAPFLTLRVPATICSIQANL